MDQGNSATQYFHSGQRQLQRESGTDTEHYEAMSQSMMVPDLKPNEVDFVAGRSFSVAASIGPWGRPWSSPLFGLGEPLFTVESATEVRIQAGMTVGDPLWGNLRYENRGLSVLFFDPARRRRSKSTGTAEVLEDGSIRYVMTRNFGLCPKYIFKRAHTPADQMIDRPEPTDGTRLSDLDRSQFGASDTIFFASSFADHGPDSTHRGGSPGFVEVIDDRTLRIPDYFGNGMFQTFGNLVIDSRIGVTTVDWVTGRTVQVSGTGSVERLDEGPIERVVTVSIDEVRVTHPVIGTWTDIEPSPYSGNY